MKRLPEAVLTVLDHLPDQTCRIILNTNGKGEWTIEAFTHYRVQEDGAMVAGPSRLRGAPGITHHSVDNGTQSP